MSILQEPDPAPSESESTRPKTVLTIATVFASLAQWFVSTGENGHDHAYAIQFGTAALRLARWWRLLLQFCECATSRLNLASNASGNACRTDSDASPRRACPASGRRGPERIDGCRL